MRLGRDQSSIWTSVSKRFRAIDYGRYTLESMCVPECWISAPEDWWLWQSVLSECDEARAKIRIGPWCRLEDVVIWLSLPDPFGAHLHLGSLDCICKRGQ